MKIQLALIFIACIQCQVGAFKILGVLPTFGKSHFNVGHGLFKGLADAGHEVTVISAFRLKTPIKNYREVYMDGLFETLMNAMGPDANFMDMNDMPYPRVADVMLNLGLVCTNGTLNNPTFQKFLRSGDKFDVIILEIFLSDAFIGLGKHFNAPLIGLSTFGASKWTADLVGTPIMASYTPHTFTGYSDRMTFFERLRNSAMYWYDDIVMPLSFYQKQQQMYETHIAGPTKYSIAELKKNVSLILLNTHVTLGFPRPYAPNMIEVGGLHIKQTVDRLPKDLQTFLDGASQGAIYFSMGSNVKSSMCPPQMLNNILNVLKEFKHIRILFKGDEADLPELPGHILVRSWFPQESILAHPNIKAFITHGGLLSTTETIHFGIPIIGIPLFGDQRMNMAYAERAGIGIKIELSEVTEARIRTAVTEILDNPKYNDNVKLISSRYRDQIKPPLETAIFWVEYVARHRGAPHLHSVAVDLAFHQLYNLDVWAFVLIIFCFVVIILKKVLLALSDCIGISGYNTAKKLKVK